MIRVLVIILLAACLPGGSCVPSFRGVVIGEPTRQPSPSTPESPPKAPGKVPVFDCTHWTYKPEGLIPGTQTAFLIDRAWRSDEKDPKSAHDMEKWKTWLRQRPRDAVVIVDEEYLLDDTLTLPRETALTGVRKRVELLKAIQDVRPDIVSTDVCGPLPRSDMIGPVYKQADRMAKWRDGNDAAMAIARPYLDAVSVELYYCPNPGKPVNGSEMEDFRIFHTANIAEARRVAEGRPVWGLVWLRTKGQGKSGWGRYVGDEMAWYMLEETAKQCDGIILWDSHYSDDGTWLGKKRYDPNDPGLKIVLKWLAERKH